MENFKTYQDIRKALSDNKITCVQLVQHHLDNISKHNPTLNAFLTVFDEEALARARVIDERITNGSAGRLAGLVVGIKDVLCYKDHPLQCSSQILDGFHSQFNGTAIQRLLDEDAIIIGRQNCDEFAMGSSNENSAFGAVRNFLDTDRVPGGSSGGSAVAVQADMCQVSLGTDTGGSVRQPAAFCGIIGLKPTYSRISRYGLAAYASSFDTIGILSKSIEDNALVLEVIAGADEVDSTASQEVVEKYADQLELDGNLRIAFLQETLENEGLQAEIKETLNEVLGILKQDGHTVEEAHFENIDHALPTYYILTTAEASSNLSRYDGVKYGYRHPNSEGLEQMYKLTRSEGFGKEVIRRILLGTFVLSASYYDAYYTKAQKVRRIIKDNTEAILDEYDAIVLPTTPSTAFRIGEFSSDPIQLYLADLFTVQASVSGIPAISIPIGTDKNGLPIGIQIMGKAFSEAKLFAISNYLLRRFNKV